MMEEENCHSFFIKEMEVGKGMNPLIFINVSKNERRSID